MTEKEFENALLRGQGRCLSAVMENPLKFSDIVLNACKSEISFDAQSEGTRSLYMCEIIKCYPDPSPFIGAAADSLKSAKSDGRWLILYLAELLGFFAADGCETARNALWDKYGGLYGELLNTDNPPEGCFNALGDFESLALVLFGESKSFYKIAEDIGRVYREKSFIGGGDFAWLWISKGKKRLRGLESRAKKSENIAAYLRASLEEERAEEELINSAQKSKLASPAPERKVKLQEDVGLLIEKAKSVPVCFDDTTGWHGIFLSVIEAESKGAKVPAEVLRYIYENNYCSFCRESVLRLMSKRGLVTREILEECGLDCNYDIRRFAKSKLKKIK
ncbi:MAG: hypothetical protein K2N30_05975 [Clostridia bacterium]|nr:hypothetical protein [Clostridia bacterium]